MINDSDENHLGLDRRKGNRRSLDQVLDELNAIYSSLEYIADGIIIINQDASIYFVTEQAKKVLSSVTHLVKLNHKISFLRQQERKLFNDFLECLVPSEPDKEDAVSHCTLLLPRTLNQNPLVLGCFNLIQSNAKSQNRGILVVRDPDCQPMPQWSAFVQQFQLTPVELRLCLSLADGMTLAEYCEVNNVTQNTARTQLKKIFEKTDVRRQTDLLRLIFNYTHT